MEMTARRWEATGAYLRDVFGREDAQLATLMQRAAAQGLPDIAVDAGVGRLLHLLVSMTNAGRGARRVVEVGTLAGYSGIWLARAMGAGGRLVTIELEEQHAAFARAEFARAGLADRVEVRVGAALDVLPALREELGPASVDVVFLDAVKTEYAAYADILIPTLRRGGLLIADNALGARDWWIDDAPGANASRDAIDAFNRRMAADARFECAMVPLREGLLIARLREEEGGLRPG